MDVLAGPQASDSVDRQRLEQALDTLPENYRVVLAMFYYEELSYKEIAEQLEIKIGTVMSRLARAKSKLKTELHAAAVDGSLGVSIPVDTLEEPANG